MVNYKDKSRNKQNRKQKKQQKGKMKPKVDSLRRMMKQSFGKSD